MSLTACEEFSEGVDDDNDIIVRNASKRDLWIEIDGISRGRIKDNGRAETMWDGIEDGRHTLRAYRSDDYRDLYCEVDTDYLNGDEDFYWYLLKDGEYSGTESGDC